MKKYILVKIIFTVFMALCFSFNMPVYAEKSISQLNKERQALQNKSEQTQNSLDGTKKEKSDVLKEVERLDSELMAVQTELNNLIEKLEKTKDELEQSENDLKKAQEDKEKQVGTFKKRIRVMYEDGIDGYLQVILEAQDFSDFLRRLEYVDKIAEFDQNIIDEYQKTAERIALNIENIKVKKEEIEKLSEEEEEKMKVLDQRIEEKENMVKKLSEDEKKYLQQLQDLKDADLEITALIKSEQARLAAKRKAEADARKKAQAEAEAKARAKAQQANKQTNSNTSTQTTTSNNSSNSTTSNTTTSNSSNNSSSSNSSSSSSSGKMAYPVPAYSGAAPNDVYGYRTNPISGKEELHTGLDLKATMNTDVVAAASGTVIFSGARGGYGNTVIIDHGDGTSTLYAHNSTLTVNVGDEVSKGQVIAKAGTTGYSTGVHLHFEVRKNGVATDPMPYLK